MGKTLLQMSRLRRLLERQGDPYAGVDLANATRLGGILWLVAVGLVSVLLPAAPPDEALGDAGWAVALGLLAASVLIALYLRRAGGAVPPNVLYLISFLAVGAVAAMVWLSGGLGTPYEQLYLLSIVYTSLVHPVRRVLLYLVVAAAALFAPLAYDQWDGREAASLATAFLLWFALSLVGMYFMSGIRRQRLGLASEGARARRQARLDPLTGLENRRAFDEALAVAIDRAQVSGKPLSVVVADLDGFKAVNDSHGHLAGDRVLREVGSALRMAIRGPDAAFRWGGDEFAVLLPGTPLADAEQVAERIRSAVGGHVCGPDGAPITVAFGAAELSDRAGAIELIAAADEALLQAKGRRAPAP